MADPQDLPSTQMAFTKYPELPKDIRLMIIDEAIEVTRQEYRKANRSWAIAKPFLFPLASINHEWNQIIETRLFRSIGIAPSDLSKFAEICGKRHGRLNSIMLGITTSEYPGRNRLEACFGAAITQLFNIIKDWSHMDRERQGMLKVVLNVHNDLINHPLAHGTNLNCNFGTLPKVPIIGALYEVGFELVLHPSSSLGLYQCCPNIRHATLGLPFLDPLSISRDQAINAITSLASTQPDLTHLELAARWHLSGEGAVHDAWMPAADCLAAFPPSWTNNLVQLDLKHMIDLPRFLLEAGRSTWPNLKVMHLLGVLDNQNKSSKEEIEATGRETCTALVQGLISMLPSMPKITTVTIKMRGTVGWWGAIQLGMKLGNPVREHHYWPEGDGWVHSYSYRFVPNYDNGVVLAVGANFPGHLATELQHTVRRHQLKDLGVFFDKEKLRKRCPCWQWNSEEQSWDAVFKEEEDEFIYQMGQYFASTESV